MATYGGEWETAQQDCIIDPFTAATGIRVTPEPGVSAVTLSKLLQQRDAPVLDAVWMHGGVSEQAATQGVITCGHPAPRHSHEVQGASVAGALRPGACPGRVFPIRWND